MSQSPYMDLDGPHQPQRGPINIQYRAGFVRPGPPPPLPPLDPAPQARAPVQSARDIPQRAHERTQSSQRETSIAPSTSVGSTRRPLPQPPASSSMSSNPALTRPRTVESAANPQADSRPHDALPARRGNGSDFSPTTSTPAGFQPSPSSRPIVLSPERLAADLPPTPSTSSSGSIHQRRHRQSQASSLSSNMSPRRSPASYNTADPPPWAIPHPSSLTQNATITPESVGTSPPILRVKVNSDPGRTVTSKLFDLCLHRGDQNTVPAYGRSDPIEGYIDLKTFDRISEINVVLEGSLRVVYFDRGQAYDEANIPLFEEKKILYMAAYNRAPGQSHSFTFAFPDKCIDQSTPLPPTWTLIQPGFTAEVTYSLRGTLKRSGLFKKDEKLSTKLEYYPRTAPPPDAYSPDSLQPRKPQYRVLEIDQNVAPIGKSVKEKPFVPNNFAAWISLKKPLVYASGSPIPYTVYLSSVQNTAIPASLDVDVTLVKISKVTVSGKSLDKRDVLGVGVIHEKQFEPGPPRFNKHRAGHSPLEGGTFEIRGTCVAGMEGHEMSWAVEGVASVSYVLRFVVSPTHEASKFAGYKDTLPTFEHSEEIAITTDETATLLSEVEAMLPARGLTSRRTRSNTSIPQVSSPIIRNPEPSEHLSGFAFGSLGSMSSPLREHSVRDFTQGAQRITPRTNREEQGLLF